MKRKDPPTSAYISREVLALKVSIASITIEYHNPKTLTKQVKIILEMFLEELDIPLTKTTFKESVLLTRSVEHW